LLETVARAHLLPEAGLRWVSGRVGVMSKTISGQLHDLVTYVAARGRVPVARAVIKGSDLRADVTVHVARTSEVAQKWLDEVDPDQGRTAPKARPPTM
jgi:hypothetical protein